MRTPGIEGVSVVATNSEGQSLRALTDNEGAFEFGGLRPGKYQLRVEKDGYISNPASREVMLVPGACPGWHFELKLDSGIAGVLLQPDGSAAGNVRVELVALRPDGSLGDSEASAQTGEDGRFQLLGAVPGDYLIGVNVTNFDVESPYLPFLYPGVQDPQASVPVRVEAGAKADIGAFWLPPRLESVPVSIRTVWPDGSIADRAEVILESHAEGMPLPIHSRLHLVTDDQGKLEIRAFKRLRQSVRSQLFRFYLSGEQQEGYSARVDLDTTAPGSEIRLVLEPRGRR
jgi:hypothetical protein